MMLGFVWISEAEVFTSCQGAKKENAPAGPSSNQRAVPLHSQSGRGGAGGGGGQQLCLHQCEEMIRFIFVNVTPPPVCSKCHLSCFHVTVGYLLASSSASPSPPPPPRLLRLKKFGVKGEEEEEEDEGIACNQLIKPQEQSSRGSSWCSFHFLCGRKLSTLISAAAMMAVYQPTISRPSPASPPTGLIEESAPHAHSSWNLKLKFKIWNDQSEHSAVPDSNLIKLRAADVYIRTRPPSLMSASQGRGHSRMYRWESRDPSWNDISSFYLSFHCCCYE